MGWRSWRLKRLVAAALVGATVTLAATSNNQTVKNFRAKVASVLQTGAGKSKSEDYYNYLRKMDKKGTYTRDEGDELGKKGLSYLAVLGAKIQLLIKQGKVSEAKIVYKEFMNILTIVDKTGYGRDSKGIVTAVTIAFEKDAKKRGLN